MAAFAQPAEACRLALAIGLDTSVSVDADEDRLQRQGLANALRADEVRQAFLVSPDPVALLVYEWSDRDQQRDLSAWTLITDLATLDAVAAEIERSTRGAVAQQTALGFALAYAAQRMEEAPDCIFQTIDIVGDGANNQGFSPQTAYATMAFDSVIVNALAVETEDGNTTQYFTDSVIRGPGSFVETAMGFSDFEAAMRRKLVRELTSQVLGRADQITADRG
ncbi:DUF1194 domain-containing protein [Yoonia litorea]|uniref:DUF1194 domain-containing protein n=1 Tax=Yoonia litorea TaxID=1123755 RepID=UPI001F620446|nr:DUF1194 domain-containing protein [Yoonia litorea]